MKCLVETSSCTSPPLTPPKKLHTQKTKHKITKTKHHNSPKQNKKNPYPPTFPFNSGESGGIHCSEDRAKMQS